MTAFIKFYPELAGKLKKLALCNSRAPRPAEIAGKDYHFRKREEIERWRGKENLIVLEVRGDLQAVDLEQAVGNTERYQEPVIPNKEHL